MTHSAFRLVQPRRLAALAIAALLTCSCNPAGNGNTADGNGVTATTASSGTDQTAWEQFAKVVTPSAIAGKVTFETWASDQDIYVANPCAPGTQPSGGCNVPVWPTAVKLAADKGLKGSVLGAAHLAKAKGTALKVAVVGPAQGCVTVSTTGPGGAAAGSNFPANGCVGEETRRDRASFDYINTNNLWSKAGLSAFFATNKQVAFPTDALVVKADWIPVEQLATWLGKDAAFVTANFYTANAVLTPGGKPTAVAMTSLHVSVKTAAFPNWVWADFENAYTPGRCDQTGCTDGFGAQQPSVPAAAAAWGQYGACAKTSAAQALLTGAKAPAVFANYCLTGTQTDYGTTAKPILLGSPIIEPLNADVPMNQSSCISCHVGASFTATGPNFPSGPIGPSSVPKGSRGYDFMWGLLGAQ